MARLKRWMASVWCFVFGHQKQWQDAIHIEHRYRCDRCAAQFVLDKAAGLYSRLSPVGLKQYIKRRSAEITKERALLEKQRRVESMAACRQAFAPVIEKVKAGLREPDPDPTRIIVGPSQIPAGSGEIGGKKVDLVYLPMEGAIPRLTVGQLRTLLNDISVPEEAIVYCSSMQAPCEAAARVLFSFDYEPGIDDTDVATWFDEHVLRDQLGDNVGHITAIRID